MTLTLDTNCIIDLEQGNEHQAALRRLVAKHNAGAIDLRVSEIVASERLREGGYAKSFATFQERIAALSARPIAVLRPIGRWNVTYWDHGVWADEAMGALEEQIHTILFSQPYRWAPIAREAGLDPEVTPAEDCDLWRKWRNRLCDSAAMWCHIHYNGDIFVTRDANFLAPSKKTALEQLGARSIAEPSQACVMVNA